MTTFILQPPSPFRLDLTVWALRRRPANAVDCWEDDTYRRALIVGGASVDVAVSQSGPPEAPSLRVDAVGITGPSVRVAVAATLERILGLSVDLGAFYTMAEVDALLGPLAGRFRGALKAGEVRVCSATRMSDVDDAGVVSGDGSHLPAARVVWTAGVRASPAAGTPGSHGRVTVNDSLQVDGRPEVFVTGDLAEISAGEGRLASDACSQG